MLLVSIIQIICCNVLPNSHLAIFPFLYNYIVLILHRIRLTTDIKFGDFLLILSYIWSKRDSSGGWRRLNNEEVHSLYRSPNIVRVNKSRRLRWAGHVARMEEGRSAFKILILGVDGRTI